MKKLVKSEIYGSVNSTRDPHMTENLLKSQTFRQRKKKKKRKAETQTRLGSAKRASQTHTKLHNLMLFSRSILETSWPLKATELINRSNY